MDDFIERMIQFNRWLKEHAGSSKPAVTLYDTSNRPVKETTRDVAEWIRKHLKEEFYEKVERTSS